jgi:hypothetical protein
MTPIACNTGSTAWPIGYCHGFPSPNRRDADEGQNGNAALDQGQHVDAIAGAARLHQQDAARAAKIGAGQQRDTLFFRGQRDGLRTGVGERAVDQDAVAGIRDIGELRDVMAAQQIVELVLPARRAAVAVGHSLNLAEISAAKPRASRHRTQPRTARLFAG